MQAAAVATSFPWPESFSLPILKSCRSSSRRRSVATVLSSSSPSPSTTAAAICPENIYYGWNHGKCGRKKSKYSTVSCSTDEEVSASPSNDCSETWLLEPVGDGDSRHIGFKVDMPGTLEILSDVVTVGRLLEKSNLVVPVATVSGVHARLEKKEGSLFVTDLNSTNSTFVDERRLPPGAPVQVPPGSCITFGDANLAMFRVSKLIKNDDTPLSEQD